MLGNPKNVFWEALLLTILVFGIGLIFGIGIEESRLNDINEKYVQSEISLMDIVAFNSMITLENSSCDFLITSNLEFADKVYEEAKLLEKYEEAGKLTNDMIIAHKRYDLLRTFLWINAIKTSKICTENFNVVVYLYEYETADLAQKATQNVWSNVLFDLKQKEGSKIILIPIAADSGLASLDSLLNKYKVNKFPVVIVNDKIITELSSVNEIEQHLK